MKMGIVLGLTALLWAAGPASASPHEVRVPLHDGKLDWADLSAAACEGIHLPPWQLGHGAISLRGWKGSLFLAALDASCGDGLRITVSDDALIFHLDAEKLPRSVEQSKQALRAFAATENPQATAVQTSRYGLFLPPHIDPAKNLVVLIHGLDCDASMLHPMGIMLEERGLQVAYFSYPGDQAITEDVKLLEKHLSALHETFPGIRVDLIGHSMGGLIARAYVEGDAYAGDVDHLIMVGTPNSGSQWARLDLLLKAQKGYYLSRRDPDWNWSWMITDGLGEGANDVLPHSEFLNRLNAGPRRTGVHYTAIAGSHSAMATVASEWTRGIESWAPPATRNWWGVRQLESGLAHQAEELAGRTSGSDGPVSVRSAMLAGVKDVVVVRADHCSLFIGNDASPPAAFPIILDRLGVTVAAQ